LSDDERKRGKKVERDKKNWKDVRITVILIGDLLTNFICRPPDIKPGSRVISQDKLAGF
jgi:hypothetical protein